MKNNRAALFLCLVNLSCLFFAISFKDADLKFGLNSLFFLKSQLVRSSPPTDTLDIEIDYSTFLEIKEVNDCLQQHRGTIDPRCFFRHLHGNLIESLNREGAKLIVFNLLFRESRGTEDIYFAQAIHTARNVLLQDYQEKRFIGQNIEIIDVSRPVSPLAENAVSAPFPMPEVPIATPHLWMLLNLIHKDETQARNYTQPTLPVMALHLLVLNQHRNALLKMLDRFAPSIAKRISDAESDIYDRRLLNELIEKLSYLFIDNPELINDVLNRLQHENSLLPEEKSSLISLFNLYKQKNDFYLNPYGATGTIKTITYQEVEKLIQTNPSLFKGKVIFIGPSLEYGHATKGGVAITPFGEISSTELLATSFANLREGKTLILAEPWHIYAISIAAGALAILLVAKLRKYPAIIALIATSLTYFVIILWLFCFHNILLPWILPIFQLLLGVLVVTVKQYQNQRQELKNILRHTMPPEVVSTFTGSDFETLKHGSSHFGVCMVSDGSGYTRLGQTKGERWLAKFTLAYQAEIEQCIQQHQGTIKDWAGDGMMALWINKPKVNQRTLFGRQLKLNPFQNSTNTDDIKSRALHAALKLNERIAAFNKRWQIDFPLRIGITVGPIWLSFAGELKVFGDIVNLAPRLETLNKQTNTQILVTDEVILNQTDFLFRRIGNFQFADHPLPTAVYEVMALADKKQSKLLELIQPFETGLKLYETEAWEEAAKVFSKLLQQFPDDGPCLYYARLCRMNSGISHE